MDKKVKDYLLEKHEQTAQVANFCSICSDPILVGDSYLPVNDYGWVCERCSKHLVVAD